MELRENSAIATYDAFKDYSSDVAVAQALFGSSNVRFWPKADALQSGSSHATLGFS